MDKLLDILQEMLDAFRLIEGDARFEAGPVEWDEFKRWSEAYNEGRANQLRADEDD